MVDKVLR